MKKATKKAVVTKEDIRKSVTTSSAIENSKPVAAIANTAVKQAKVRADEAVKAIAKGKLVKPDAVTAGEKKMAASVKAFDKAVDEHVAKEVKKALKAAGAPATKDRGTKDRSNKGGRPKKAAPAPVKKMTTAADIMSTVVTRDFGKTPPWEGEDQFNKPSPGVTAAPRVEKPKPVDAGGKVSLSAIAHALDSQQQYGSSQGLDFSMLRTR
jgi:hypothetical protein